MNSPKFLIIVSTFNGNLKIRFHFLTKLFQIFHELSQIFVNESTFLNELFQHFLFILAQCSISIPSENVFRGYRNGTLD